MSTDTNIDHEKVMELFGKKPKPTQLPISSERLKKVFDAVNNSSRPEFFKNDYPFKFEQYKKFIGCQINIRLKTLFY